MEAAASKPQVRVWQREGTCPRGQRGTAWMPRALYVSNVQSPAEIPSQCAHAAHTTRLTCPRAVGVCTQWTSPPHCHWMLLLCPVHSHKFKTKRTGDLEVQKLSCQPRVTVTDSHGRHSVYHGRHFSQGNRQHTSTVQTKHWSYSSQFRKAMISKVKNSKKLKKPQEIPI